MTVRRARGAGSPLFPEARPAGDPLNEDVLGSRTFVIFNPAAGRGRGARRIGAYRELLLHHLPGAEIRLSEYAGHEAVLADEALARGFTRLVAVGGDGTWSHVADRILASGQRHVALGLLPSGTGNDFGRNLGLSFSDPSGAVERLVHGDPVSVDVGRIHTPSRPVSSGNRGVGELAPRHFLNVVGVGFDVAVVEAASSARFLKGETLYKVTALQQLFRFRGLPVALREGDAGAAPRRHLVVTVTNGAYFGGGFPITPDARIDDGLLHACVIEDASPWRRMLLFAWAQRGRHVHAPEVQLRTGPRYTLSFDGPVRFEADGDLFDTDSRELSLEVLPRALTVVGP